MRNFTFFFLISALLIAGLVFFPRYSFEHKIESTDIDVSTNSNARILSSVEKSSVKIPKTINLPVPYVAEAPDNIWVGSWKNSCEESVIVMVEKYYEGDFSVPIIEAKNMMQGLFDYEVREFGSDANSNAEQMIQMIKDNMNYRAQIRRYPTIEEIKIEIDSGRPVIGLHRGFDLGNKNIPFNPAKSSFHTTVVKGYDDLNRVFITNDPGDNKDGVNHLYDYDVFMNSLHDFNSNTNTSDGTPTVIFTTR